MGKTASTNYRAVDLAALNAGMIVDRPLYAYLTHNDRYMLMVRPGHVLETRVLDKLQRIGKVYSTLPPLRERFPDLYSAAQLVRQLCQSHDVAPFEKNKVIREKLQWLVQGVVRPVPVLVADDTAEEAQQAAVFFIQTAFDVPKPATLQFVSDASVVMYEQVLRVAAVSGLLALWLGFSDFDYISKYVQGVFCEEVGLEQVPGVPKLEQRFKQLVSDRAVLRGCGDELASIVCYARALCAIAANDVAARDVARVIKKVGLLLVEESTKPSEVAA